MSEARNEFIMRLIVPTAIMGASLWYLGSLWDARMRDQNLMLIRPVVVAMIPFYFWIIAFEVRKYRAVRGEAGGYASIRPSNLDHLKFMAIAVTSLALFYLFGAIPATVVSLVVSLAVLGVRRPLPLILVPLVTTTALWLVFIQVFGIRMPLLQVPW